MQQVDDVVHVDGTGYGDGLGDGIVYVCGEWNVGASVYGLGQEGGRSGATGSWRQ